MCERCIRKLHRENKKSNKKSEWSEHDTICFLLGLIFIILAAIFVFAIYVYDSWTQFSSNGQPVQSEFISIPNQPL